MVRLFIIVVVIVFANCGCKHSLKKEEPETGSVKTAWPDTSYWNKPEAKFDSSDYVIQLKHMQPFYDVPGEFGHIAEGKDYGFTDLSFILTNTQPNGGPPLHTHTTEEAHILQEGSVIYVVGDKKFSAKGPYIFRIPPGIPHTFLNSGNKPFNLVAVFPGNSLSYTELGRNPLVKDTSVYHGHKH